MSNIVRIHTTDGKWFEIFKDESIPDTYKNRNAALYALFEQLTKAGGMWDVQGKVFHLASAITRIDFITTPETGKQELAIIQPAQPKIERSDV